MTFAQKVFQVVSKIPRGSVMTYKQVAKLAGQPRAYRAVGNILHRNLHPAVGYHHPPRLRRATFPPKERGRLMKNPHLNPLPLKERKHCLVIPCHRVVKSNGEVGGYLEGGAIKMRLLQNEGIKINNGVMIK